MLLHAGRLVTILAVVSDAFAADALAAAWLIRARAAVLVGFLVRAFLHDDLLLLCDPVGRTSTLIIQLAAFASSVISKDRALCNGRREEMKSSQKSLI